MVNSSTNENNPNNIWRDVSVAGIQERQKKANKLLNEAGFEDKEIEKERLKLSEKLFGKSEEYMWPRLKDWSAKVAKIEKKK